MKVIRLNGAKMVDKAITHAYLKEKLALSDYYGQNLDALWDCLSTDFSQKKIIINHPEIITKNLGSYGRLVIRLFQEVAYENKCVQVDIKYEPNE